MVMKLPSAKRWLFCHGPNLNVLNEMLQSLTTTRYNLYEEYVLNMLYDTVARLAVLLL